MAAPTYTARTAWSIASTALTLPFDTTGAVGPDSVISVSNQGVDCYTKEGSQLWKETLKAFFGTSFASPFDPRIVYDPAAERFFIIAVKGKDIVGDTESVLLIAVSADSAPQAGHDEDETQWTILSEDVSQSSAHFLDYPLIGFDADVVTIMGQARPKLTTGQPNNFHYMVYVIPKSDLTDGSPSIDNMETLEILADPNRDFAHPVSDLDDGSLPHTLWAWDDTAGELDRFDVTLSGSYSVDKVATIAYSTEDHPIGPVSVVQPTGGDDEPLNNFVNNIIGTSPVRVGGFDYIVLSSDDGTGLATIVVVKIDTTIGSSDLNTIVAKTILAEDGLSLIYPSIAVNSSGHIVVGCTSVGAAATAWASAMVFVGQDDGATMTFAAGEVVQAGQRYYENTLDPSGRLRWGDYSATVVDPLSPTRFWTFQSWAWDNAANDAGRKMEVTEVITTPSGVFDLFGWTMGWHSTTAATTPTDYYRVYAQGTLVPTVVAQGTVTPKVFAQATDTPTTFAAS